MSHLFQQKLWPTGDLIRLIAALLRRIAAASVLILLLPAVVWAQTLDLPQRNGPRPTTTGSVPHVQIDPQTDPVLTEQLLQAVGAFKGIVLAQTRIGFPGSVGFNLDQSVPLAKPGSIVVGREIAHIHPDGSLHAALDPALAEKAIALGWAEAHPWAKRRVGWDGFVMIFTPTNPNELSVVIALLEESYRYITGTSPTD